MDACGAQPYEMGLGARVGGQGKEKVGTEGGVGYSC